MERIVVDANLPKKLAGLENTVELCDPSGRVLGMFVPHIDPSEFESLEPDISEEELDRRENSPGPRYTTSEVLQHLRSLGPKDDREPPGESETPLSEGPKAAIARMIVDQNQSERLGRQMHPADLCDPYGRVLGRFIPDLSGYEGLEPPIDEEELQRIEREGGGRKLADILAGLQNRG